MIVLVAPFVLGLSPGLLFPLNVENDESVGPTEGTWVVAIFERRFCGFLPELDGADKSDELAWSGLAMPVGAAASSAEECGLRLTRDTPGPARTSLRAPTELLVLSFGCSGISSSWGVFSSGTGTFSTELVCTGDSVFSGSFLKGNLGESAILLWGAGRVLLTATDVSGAETVLYVTNDDRLDSNDCRGRPFGIDGVDFSGFGLGFTVKLGATGKGSQTGGGGGRGSGWSRSSRASAG